jgi:hypothetical protein
LSWGSPACLGDCVWRRGLKFISSNFSRNGTSGVGISLTPPTLRALSSIGLRSNVLTLLGFDRITFEMPSSARAAEMQMPRLAGKDCSGDGRHRMTGVA